MKKVWITLIVAAGLSAGWLIYRSAAKDQVKWQEVKVEATPFRVTVQASGTVQPENKVAIIAPIAGRIDKILVDEGRKVHRGQILAWMSSTDRAALLDSARAQGAEALKEWESEYKPTPILAPAGGIIISRDIVEGQTVTQQSTLFDLSDRLVIMADVDETDLGKISLNQEAEARVDSFPDQVVKSKVAKIAHESVLKNNINTYQVLLRPENLPKEFRAGLTASVQFKFLDKAGTLTLPAWVAEGRENSDIEVQLKNPGKGAPVKKKIRVGLSNGERIEVVSGASEGDILLFSSKNVFNEAGGGSPLGLPSRRRAR